MLAQVLGSFSFARTDNLIVGPETLDDAGVYRLTDEIALVQTVDFFPPVCDDPRMFGRIAAANSLSHATPPHGFRPPPAACRCWAPLLLTQDFPGLLRYVLDVNTGLSNISI